MKKFLLSTLAMLFVAAGTFAQVTTSSLTGSIRDAQETLIGASVKATHTPTGTVYGTSTGADGRFTIPNMRVGGPYTIDISFVGYQPKRITEVFLKLGEPYILNVVMEGGNTLNEVVVTAANPNSVLNADRTGTNTTLTRTQIINAPTITRSVNDLTRFTPQANGTSIGGGNYRQNNFTVDGSDFNNTFGIGTNVPAGGSPISIDALEQISVNVTPYDVRQSGFIGGAVNAVTRSGTNKFFGNAFFTTRNEDFRGDKVGGTTVPLQQYEQNQYGFSFGGPLVKDKLFFFVNAEFNKEVAPGQNRLAATPSMPYVAGQNIIARPTAAQLDGIRNYLVNTYGYDPGAYQGYSNLSNNDKFLARLDWNITPNHRFNVRYNQVESKSPSFVSTSRSPLSGYSGTEGRTSINALHFQNSNYYQDANLYSLAAELNSSFGSKFSNKLRGSYTNQNDPRSSDSSPFPFVDILEAGTPFTSFGYEPFTFGNLRDVETYSFTNDFSMALGKHNVTLGLQADFSTTKNGFQRFATSYYTFNSWADFVNGANPRDFAITYSLLPGYQQAFPSFKFAQYSAYIQDEFTVSDRVKLTAGLRVDRPSYPSTPEIKTHPLVAALNFGGEKVDTGVMPEARYMFSPRFGFNWDVKGDRSLQVRGGSGIFTGRVPFVWIVSQSGDAGLLQFTQTFVGQTNTPGPFSPDPARYRPATQPAAGTSIPSAISAIDPDFKFPQTWKSSLAFDMQLPWGIVGTLEGIYNKDLNAAIGRNANLVDPTNLAIAGYPDNRPFYPSANQQKFRNPLTSAGQASPAGTNAFNVAILDNAKGGHTYSVTAQLNKQFGKNLTAMVAYTRSGGENFGDGTGDQLLNVWSIPFRSNNSNVAQLGYSSNLMPDRVIASVNYRKEWLKNLATGVSLFYEGSIQGRYSYTYSADFNRDGQTNDLIYVPASPSEIDFVTLTIGSGATAKTYTPQQQSDIFFAYIEQDDYLRSRKGQYAERNGAKLPWRNQVDFRFTQEVFKNVGNTKNSFQLTWDIFNVGNFLNKDWGHVEFATAPAILQPANVASISNTTRPTFRMATFGGDIVRTSYSTTQSITSTYYMQFGFRYNFQ